MIASGILKKVKQLALEIHFGTNSTMDECRSYTKTLKSLEDYGFVRFSSKVNTLSHNWHEAMGVDEYLSYELAWLNSDLKLEPSLTMFEAALYI